MPRSPEQQWRHQITLSALSPTTRHVAHTYALHMDADGSNAKVGIRKLMVETGLAFNTIAAAIRTLEDDKWLLCTLPAAGKRPATFAANIPGDIWDEIVLERPEEQMRRDKARIGSSDATTESLGDLVTQPLSHKPEEAESYPQVISSDAVSESLGIVARGLRAASDATTESNLDLDLKKEPPTPYSSESPPGGGEEQAPGYRNPTLWNQALEVARDNGADNPTAYASSVYRRLVADHDARGVAIRIQLEIDRCPDCTSNGLIETDSGWIRHNHGE